MALAPEQETVRLHQIDFILLRPGLAMSIMVFQGGLVQNKMLQVDAKLGADDLVTYSNFLNERFQGQSLLEIKRQLLREMDEARYRFDALYHKALNLVSDALPGPSQRQVFVEGTLYVFDQIDPQDISSMRELLELLEQRSELLELLDKVATTQGLTITFGTEFAGHALGRWSLISSPYTVRGETLGIIGTIGPIHMDYSKLVPVVDTIAKMLSEILESRF